MTLIVDSSFFRLVILGCFIFLNLNAFAQTPDWARMMQDPYADFEATRHAFESYWSNRKISKGAGWKPFKRWEHYMETRITPQGTQEGPMRTASEFQAYLRTHPRENNSQRTVTTANWRQVGPVTLPENGTTQPNGIGRVNCIAFHPADPAVLFIGSPSGGCWKSADYGMTWNKHSQGLVRLGVSSIVIDPTDPDIMYIGTGDRDAGHSPGLGVWYSVDGGQNWQARNTGMGNRTVNEILMHPTNSSILIAATSGSGGGNGRIYRSVNGGASWTQVYNGPEIFKDLAFKPGDPNTVYAGSDDFFRSQDNGQSWSQVSSGVPLGNSRIAIAVSEDQPSAVYLLIGDNTGFRGFYYSGNSGTSFSMQSASPNICGYGINGGSGNQSWYDLVALADPNDVDHVFVGAINLWESFDGGQTWSIVTHWDGAGGNPAIHADDHALEYSPHSGDLFLGHDGGIHFSTDGGISWNDISNGLAIAQVYHIAGAATQKRLILNGYQDNGMAIYREGKWTTELGGDVLECAIDYSDESVMYGAIYNGDIRRSTNGGISFSTIGAFGKNGINETGAFETPFQLHPTDPNVMYAGYNNVWRTHNCKAGAAATVNWNKVSTFPINNHKIRRLSIAPSNPDVIYLSRDGSNRFYRTTNASAGSPAWTDLTANLPAVFSAYFPKAIEVHPTDPATLWIALGHDIFQSTDAGNSWTNISGSLPDISLNTIAYDSESPVGAMYVGMDAGVYYRNNSMTDWVLFDLGLPGVEITELEFYHEPGCRGNDRLRAATYGRGLWETELRDPGTLAPAVCFTALQQDACEGTPVQLRDQSAYVPTNWHWSFSPATVTYVNGTNANSQHPRVVFDAPGIYTVSLNVGNVNGTDTEIRPAYISIGGTPQTIPVAEGFDGVGLCGTSSDCGLTTCSLPGGWKNLTNGSEDDIDWRVNTGGTVSNNTGPSGDATSGSGNYLYIEASGSCSFQTATLVSPCLDLGSTSSPQLTFAYHMYGANMGELHVDVLYGGQWHEDIISPIMGDQGNQWLTQIVNLSAFGNSIINLRFRAVTGPGYLSDMALDDISVSGVFPVELVDFTATLSSSNEVQLDWITASEQQNDYFEVERSTDGQTFEPLHRIDGKGNSQVQQEYRSFDLRPHIGKNYYRLRQVDADGAFTYSERAEVEVSWIDYEGARLSPIYPNPFRDQLSVEVELAKEGMVQVAILNSLGQVLRSPYPRQMKAGWQQLTLDTADLPAGVYYIQVSGADFFITRQALLQR